MSQTDAKGHQPTKLDKWLLVKYGKYATREQIPNTVSSITMRAVHDRARVHASIGIMVVGLLGMFGSALYGRYRHGQGDSLHSLGVRKMQIYKEQREKEIAAEELKNKAQLAQE